MADDVQSALEELPAGTTVRVTLKDGEELEAVTGEGSELTAGDESVDVDQIDTVLLDASSADPE